MFEQYDVVHIAIFMLLISKNDPSPLLKNLIKMLSRDHEHRHSAENGTDKFAKNQVAISSGTSWIGVADVRWQYIPHFPRVIFVRSLTTSHHGRMRLGQRRNYPQTQQQMNTAKMLISSSAGSANCRISSLGKG